MSSEVVALLAPEILLVVAATLIYVLGAFSGSQKAWGWIALAGLLAGAAALRVSPTSIVGGPLRADALASFGRWLALGAGVLLVLLAWRPLDAPPGTSEYMGSLVLTIAGLMLATAANDIVLVFLGLELVSIPTYVLLYLGRRDLGSQEAATKYFFLSVLASAIFLYGLSFLYGATGSTDLPTIHQRLVAAQGGFGMFARIAIVLVVGGLSFRIAAVPFHFYAPDVYQGTTHANAGFLSVVPKIAGFVVLVRLVAATMPGAEPYIWRVAAVLAVLTMTLGNVVALWQNNLRRLLAYSSIAHAGYMLVGLSAHLGADKDALSTWDGVGALLFYLLVYVVATTGAFAALNCLGRGQRAIEDVEELTGLAWTGGPLRTVLAWTLAVCLFSLTGIPPLAGFWGKLGVFMSALAAGRPGSVVQPWLVTLAVIGVINSAIAAAYYLRIVGLMFFRLPLAEPTADQRGAGTLAAAVLCGVMVLAVGFYPGPWIRGADRASPRGREIRNSKAEIHNKSEGLTVYGPHAQPCDRTGHAVGQGRSAGLPAG